MGVVYSLDCRFSSVGLALVTVIMIAALMPCWVDLLPLSCQDDIFEITIVVQESRGGLPIVGVMGYMSMI